MKVARIIFVQAVVTAMALLIVWQSREIRRDGHRLERLNRETQRRRADIARLRAEIDRLQNPRRITRLVEALGLDLRQPPAPSADESEAEQNAPNEQSGAERDRTETVVTQNPVENR